MHNYLDYTRAIRNSRHTNKDKLQRQVYFVICESCYWCASTERIQVVTNKTVDKCPSCYDNKISIIPISRGQYV